jgi:hypothetical protein
MCWLVGHVVTIERGPFSLPDKLGDDWYSIDAGWARRMFPGSELQVQREHLQPLGGGSLIEETPALIERA